MKKTYLLIALSLLLIPSVAVADVGANDLRSQAFSLAATVGTTDETKYQFNEAEVRVQEISVVPTRSPNGGSCRVNIIINDLLAKIMIWEPPGSIVRNEQGGVNGGLIVAGKWEPPGGIVFTPNDVLKVQVSAIDGGKAKGDCAADFLVLGAVPFQ
jgi:hypothetical protein